MSGFRVLSYNIHQGLTVHKKQLALSSLKAAIMSLEPDVVLLQEVAGVGKGDEKSFQLEVLAGSMWPHTAYGRNSIFSGGFHGNAILSRYPIKRWENVDISVKALRRVGLGKILPKRGLLHAEVEVEGGVPVHFLATHFGLLQVERRRQLKHLCDHIKKAVPEGAPFLVAGDFNDWRQKVTAKLSRALNVKEAHHLQHKRHARTFPSRFPLLCLDRIYFRSLSLKGVRRVEGHPWLHLSDHLPLLADFAVG